MVRILSSCSPGRGGRPATIFRRRLAGARLGAALAIAGCAGTTVTLRSNHFHLAVPSDWQVVEAGGGQESATLLRTRAKDGAREVELRLYAWMVAEPPSDAAGDVLHRLAATNVLGLAAARPDDERCPGRATQFFVFGKPARAIHLTSPDGRRIIVTAGESGGSLVGVVAAVAPGGAGCADVDAAVERLAAALTAAGDLAGPSAPPTTVPSAAPDRVP